MTPATMRRIKERRRKEREAKFRKDKAKFMAINFVVFVGIIYFIGTHFLEKSCQTYSKFC